MGERDGADTSARDEGLSDAASAIDEKGRDLR